MKMQCASIYCGSKRFDSYNCELEYYNNENMTPSSGTLLDVLTATTVKYMKKL